VRYGDFSASMSSMRHQNTWKKISEERNTDSRCQLRDRWWKWQAI